MANILDFWFQDEIKSKWFEKDLEFDEKLKDLFEANYQKSSQANFQDLIRNNDPKAILSHIIFLDQIPRNIYRNTKKSFKTDEIAQKLSKYGIKHQLDKNLNKEEKQIFYMPLMHSESLKDQELSVELFKKHAGESSTKFAIAHYDIIKKFKHFPHRNEVLGRKSTKEELEFLKTEGSSF